MAEVLLAFSEMVLSPDGSSYSARACGVKWMTDVGKDG